MKEKNFQVGDIAIFGMSKACAIYVDNEQWLLLTENQPWSKLSFPEIQKNFRIGNVFRFSEQLVASEAIKIVNTIFTALSNQKDAAYLSLQFAHQEIDYDFTLSAEEKGEILAQSWSAKNVLLKINEFMSGTGEQRTYGAVYFCFVSGQHLLNRGEFKANFPWQENTDWQPVLGAEWDFEREERIKKEREEALRKEEEEKRRQEEEQRKKAEEENKKREEERLRKEQEEKERIKREQEEIKRKEEEQRKREEEERKRKEEEQRKELEEKKIREEELKQKEREEKERAEKKEKKGTPDKKESNKKKDKANFFSETKSGEKETDPLVSIQEKGDAKEKAPSGCCVIL